MLFAMEMGLDSIHIFKQLFHTEERKQLNQSFASDRDFNYLKALKIIVGKKDAMQE